MDLIDRLNELSTRAQRQLEHLQTEEATKNALVMPFITALGYDVFNPIEVIPEFTADVGIKKGEKVDYAIMRDGEPIILFECKCVGSNLSIENSSQLYRYFSVTPVRFGVLTDGIRYQVYSDLEDLNKMDSRPFLEFTLLEVTDQVVEELKKFSKGSFDLEEILSTASELKYTRGIKRVLAEEYQTPSEPLVRLLTGRVHSGRFTQSVRDQFTVLVKKAFHQFVNDRVNERLKSALAQSNETEHTEPGIESDVEDAEVESDIRIETTEEEIEGFHIVKAIVSNVVDPARVVMRDTQSYCGVLLDDNNRKPICRLRFNGSKKYIGLFDESRKETRTPIDSLSELYSYTEQLRSTASGYDANG